MNDVIIPQVEQRHLQSRDRLIFILGQVQMSNLSTSSQVSSRPLKWRRGEDPCKKQISLRAHELANYKAHRHFETIEIANIFGGM